MTTYKNISRKIRESRILYDVSLELTYKCNLDCFYCYNDRDKQGVPLSLDDYKVLLQDLADMQTMYLMLTGGEPMIHPHFFEIGRMARDLGFVTRVRTNGHNLTTRMAQRVYNEVDPFMVEVSLHGASEESHDRQTRVPGSFNKLIKNIVGARETGLKVKMVATPTSWNEHEVSQMFELSDKIDIPIRFQGPVGPRDNGDTEPLTIQPKESVWDEVKRITYARYEADVESGKIQPIKVEKSEREETRATCGVGVSGVDIDPYGNVKACMHIEENAGNIHEFSIKDIWERSPLFLRARKRAVEAAKLFEELPVKQLGAPVYCLAIEENCNKGCSNTGCGRHD